MNFNGNLNTVTLVVNQDNIGQIDRRRLRGDGGEVGQKGATQSQYKSPFIVFFATEFRLKSADHFELSAKISPIIFIYKKQL